MFAVRFIFLFTFIKDHTPLNNASQCHIWMLFLINNLFGIRLSLCQFITWFFLFFILSLFATRFYNGRQVLLPTCTSLVCWIEWMKRQRHRPTILISIINLLVHCTIRFMQNKLLYLWIEDSVVGLKHDCLPVAGAICMFSCTHVDCWVRRCISTYNVVINLWHKCSLTNRQKTLNV